MARIFIAYVEEDTEFASQLSDELSQRQHRVIAATQRMIDELTWDDLFEWWKGSDVIVFIASNISVKADFFEGTFRAAVTYSTTAGTELFYLRIDGGAQPPGMLEYYYFRSLEATDRDPKRAAKKLHYDISEFLAARGLRNQAAAAVAERIEASAPEFIDEAIKSLRDRESRDGRHGRAWYVIGFLALVAGIPFVLFAIAYSGTATERSWADIAILSLKTIVVVGLLGACAKYAFTLGKSYISESLKSADRIHAISFGKFYLQAFGSESKWPELKEVFQHWNIDRSSSFSSLDPAQFDPKLVETLLEIARIVTKAPKK
jgi:hypothetical protein